MVVNNNIRLNGIQKIISIIVANHVPTNIIHDVEWKVNVIVARNKSRLPESIVTTVYMIYERNAN